MTSVTLRAGGGRADITPPPGVAMGGYGARTGPAVGVIDPLLARAAVFDDGATQVAVVVCDLLGVSRRIVEAARPAVEAVCGIPAAHVLIAATHTHAGPAAVVGRADDDQSIELAVRGITDAAVSAFEDTRPVVLKTTAVDVGSIGRNRRHPDGPYETRLKVVVAEGDDGRPVVTLLNHACHATVLEADNRKYSADFPGAAVRAVERSVGGVGVYLQGACGDVNPVWMAHDRSEVERVGGIVGLAGARAVHELRPVGAGQRVINLSWSEEVPVEPVHGEVVQATPLTARSTVVELEWRPLPSDAELDAATADAEARAEMGEPESRRRARAERNRLAMERTFRRFAAEPGKRHKAEVQVLGFGDALAIVALPGEFFTEIGWEIERRAPRPHVLICGYANNYLGYFPTPEAFAHDGYEVGCARFEPDASTAFVDGALRLLS